jgi:twitching motility two-component system response regulator PilH
MSRILVVDDSSTYRQMISEVLAGQGHEIALAVNGADGLEKITSFRPDLVVLDVVMPEMNGYDVCRNLRKDPATQNLPVLMCSSKDEASDLYWGKKQGASAYLVKPFDSAELLATVEQLLATLHPAS